MICILYYLLLLGKDVSLCFLRTLLTNAAEICVIDVGRDFNFLNVESRAGSNNEMLVNSADWNTVDLVWTYKMYSMNCQVFIQKHVFHN